MTAPDRIWLDWLKANRSGHVYDEPPERPTQPGQTGYTRTDLIPAMIEAAVAKERERCAMVAEAHLRRLPHYAPNAENNLGDKVEEGYGNACVNIAAAIREGKG